MDPNTATFEYTCMNNSKFSAYVCFIVELRGQSTEGNMVKTPRKAFVHDVKSGISPDRHPVNFQPTSKERIQTVKTIRVIAHEIFLDPCLKM
jgi:hypothetical protein